MKFVAAISLVIHSQAVTQLSVKNRRQAQKYESHCQNIKKAVTFHHWSENGQLNIILKMKKKWSEAGTSH